MSGPSRLHPRVWVLFSIGRLGDFGQASSTPVWAACPILLMDKILHDLKDSKLWELWYIPYNGYCRILSISSTKATDCDVPLSCPGPRESSTAAMTVSVQCSAMCGLGMPKCGVRFSSLTRMETFSSVQPQFTACFCMGFSPFHAFLG